MQLSMLTTSVFMYGMCLRRTLFPLALSVYPTIFRHDPAELIYTQVTFLIQLSSHWSTSFTKLSILFFYRRLVVGSHSKNFLRVVKLAMTFQIAAALTVAIAIFLDCRPLNALWLSYSVDPPYKQPYECINNGIFWPIVSGIAVLTDFIATVLPCWIVYRLQIPKVQKYLMYAIFSLGLLVCLAGIARMIEYVRVLDYSLDILWDAYYLWYWTALEANGALICASAPALKPFLDRFLKKMQFSKGSSGSGSTDTTKGMTKVPGPSITTTAASTTRPATAEEGKLPVSKYNTTLPQDVRYPIERYHIGPARQDLLAQATHAEYYSDGSNRGMRQAESSEKVRGSESQDMGRPVEWFSHV